MLLWLFFSNLLQNVIKKDNKCNVCFCVGVRPTGRVTAAWWRSCPPSGRTRKAVTRSRTWCPARPARLCASAGGSTHHYVPLCCPLDPSAPPPSRPAPSPCRYQWSALQVRLESSAPGKHDYMESCLNILLIFLISRTRRKIVWVLRCHIKDIKWSNSFP